jgi:hypothetical protein
LFIPTTGVNVVEVVILVHVLNVSYLTLTDLIVEPGVFQMLSVAGSVGPAAKASIDDMTRRLMPIEKTKSKAMSLQTT